MAHVPGLTMYLACQGTLGHAACARVLVWVFVHAFPVVIAVRAKAVSILLALCLGLLPAARAEEPGWSALEESAERAFVDGRQAEAESLWHKALAEAEKADASGLEVASTLNQLTHLYVSRKQYEKGRLALERALKIRESRLGRQNIRTAETLGNLALVCQKLGRLDEAEKYYSECLAIKEGILGKDAAETSVTLHNLANLLSGQHRCDEAKKLYLKAAEIDRKVLGDDHVELARDLTSLGIHLYRCGDFADAARQLTDALALMEKKKGGEDPELVATLHYLGLVHARLGKPDVAEGHYKRALAIKEKVHGKEAGACAVHKMNVARVADELGRGAEAEGIYLELLGKLNSGKPRDEFRLAECHIELAHFYRRHKEGAKAKEHFQAALASYDRLGRQEQRQLYELPLAYADLLDKSGHKPEAEAMRTKYLHIHKPAAGEMFHSE